MFLSLIASLCFFTPPEGWLLAKPKEVVQIAFLHPGGDSFPPRITLTSEENSGSLKGYVKAVKEIQKEDPSIKNWRDLGALSMPGGKGRLTEMSKSSPLGEIKIFQAFFVQNDTAYILTASLLQKDLPTFRSDLMKAFCSLSVVPDLLAPVEDPEKKSKLQSLLSAKDREALTQELTAYSDLGPYWQYLVLESVSSK